MAKACNPGRLEGKLGEKSENKGPPMMLMCQGHEVSQCLFSIDNMTTSSLGHSPLLYHAQLGMRIPLIKNLLPMDPYPIEAPHSDHTRNPHPHPQASHNKRNTEKRVPSHA